MKDVVVGIDIGGTFSKFGIVDKSGEVLIEGSIPTRRDGTIDDFAADLYKAVYTDNKSREYQVKGVGIGAPNGNYYTGTIEYAPNLSWKGIVPLASAFEKQFKVPVAVTNDANAAAIGEMLFGDAKGMKNFIMITLGTGLGSGLVVNGDLVYGHDGFAGELGHTVVIPEGRQCACDKRGCLETYVSAPGIKRTFFEIMASETDESELRKFSFDEMDSKMISEAAEKGDKLALKAFDQTGKYLGMKLADAVAHTSPEAIFLFGGLALSGDLIFAPTKKYMEYYLLKVFRNKVKLLPSALVDKNIAVLGAGALIWNELAK
jgi:glucokinase